MSPLRLTVSASTSPIETSPAPPTVAENSDVPLISKSPSTVALPLTRRFPWAVISPPVPPPVF